MINYPKAPITEAIFDIRIDQLEHNDLAEIQKIQELVQGFPNVKKHFHIASQIQFNTENEIIQSDNKASALGFVLTNAERTKHFQARLDGFTFNMLPPYTNWEEFSSTALELWDIYDKALKPKNIIRIAVRFINKIFIPFPFKDFDDYFTTIPKIPKNLPETFTGFFSQINVPFIGTNRSVILTQTIEPIIKDVLPFILDLDVFETGVIKREDLVSRFAELRIIKNETFENCITENTRKLFI
jgi:uncharacterized protein (TIGR04255 family)